MSLFGTTPSDDANDHPSAIRRGGSGLFDEPVSGRNSTNTLFEDGDTGAASPWDLPTPRRQQSRAELIRSLLPSSEVPDSYIDIFDTVVREDGVDDEAVTAAGVAKLFHLARLDADAQARIMSLVAPGGDSSDVLLGRNEFNVLLALIGLAQEGDIVSLDGVDERRRKPVLPLVADLSSARMPQSPPEPQPEMQAQAQAQPQSQSQSQSQPQPQPQPQPQMQSQMQSQMQNQMRPQAQAQTQAQPSSHAAAIRAPMDLPDEDPWSAPDLHKGHNHAQSYAYAPSQALGQPAQASIPRSTGAEYHQQYPHAAVNGRGGYAESMQPSYRERVAGQPRQYSAPPIETARPPNGYRHPSTNSIGAQNGWGAGYLERDAAAAGGSGFHDPPLRQNTGPLHHGFGGDLARRSSVIDPSGPPLTPARSLGTRNGSPTEEHVIVTLMPGKEGIFLFQHHNYEVTSHRRGSKVVRRYSDFVWLLDCLHKRYPFRSLPLLPPKRVAVNGNHLSNDGAFIEKRRRGLSRFLNAVVRHPVLSQEQLVIMFLTVPTELAVWRKQATISVQDEFTDRALPEGLEDSLPATLENLFLQTRNGIRRSAELYINACNIMDRLVKRSEGVAADHGRLAMTLTSLTDVSGDTYATEASEVPLLNDGLNAMSKHLRICQNLMEDESRGWDEGVLEDLKRQRDALVSLREMFDRRERLDKDSIPQVQRRIEANEAKLAGLRARAEEGIAARAGEMEKIAEAIIKDKEAIVQQRNRSIFVKECIRDELLTFQLTQYHVSRWNQDWAGERVKYSEMLADNWRRLLEGLDGMPLGD
ncbi:Sorting nexin mvp1 [Escovopsis weberi]|uniref:Sorting nexin MVP1 n=1 Tax=Escovopsis weberi TaxID=150374 RepID=A0A0M8N6I0_ESCWE|nr:Sorting nexin mvp1 [Escovopsis weberi]